MLRPFFAASATSLLFIALSSQAGSDWRMLRQKMPSNWPNGPLAALVGRALDHLDKSCNTTFEAP